ncbi:uncharacterized protein SCHCODRAFT_01299815 [Schizophyllum commune H4-8]|uniref:uncharacterized protein n=1 Tax=Schizophyllum commune (strain H4-8 / FGSC 9210) TaxID=578458 RepID=UPI002160696D|nr:uncharacterized protein SCHCODRAFT_01299815 [Schizophyllum commune H4-8]KAI5892189.1 hypothetical protein SCHCODRAFT_01299815 [Schizophyllum commune H4-8]
MTSSMSTEYNYASAALPSLTRSLSDVSCTSLSSSAASTSSVYNSMTGSVLQVSHRPLFPLRLASSPIQLSSTSLRLISYLLSCLSISARRRRPHSCRLRTQKRSSSFGKKVPLRTYRHAVEHPLINFPPHRNCGHPQGRHRYPLGPYSAGRTTPRPCRALTFRVSSHSEPAPRDLLLALWGPFRLLLGLTLVQRIGCS